MGYYVDLATLSFISLTAVVGVFALTGLTGLFSFGQGGFMALGAYTAVLTHMRLGVPFPIALLLGVLMTMAASFLIGLPALKLRRDFFALATFGFGEAVTAIFQMFTQVTGGTMGLGSIPRLTTWWMALAAAVLAIYLVANLKRSKLGRQSIAIRTDELAAQALGIDAFRHKMTVFVICSGLAGLAGGLQGFFIYYMDPRIFNWTTSVEQVIIVYFGGINSLTGAIVSSLLLSTLPEALRFASMWRVVIYAALIILIMNLRPQGLMGSWEFSIGAVRRLFRGRNAKSGGCQYRGGGVLMAVNSGEILLKVDGISKSFGGVNAVVDFSMELREHHLVGLIGPNGAGKTTVFNLLSGITPIDRGKVTFQRPGRHLRDLVQPGTPGHRPDLSERPALRWSERQGQRQGSMLPRCQLLCNACSLRDPEDARDRALARRQGGWAAGPGGHTALQERAREEPRLRPPAQGGDRPSPGDQSQDPAPRRARRRPEPERSGGDGGDDPAACTTTRVTPSS